MVLCSLCTKHLPHFSKQKSGFAVGSTQLKKYALQCHDKENCDHLKAREIDMADKIHKLNPGSLPAEKMLAKMNKARMEQMQLLFSNAHAIAKHRRPFTDLCGCVIRMKRSIWMLAKPKETTNRHKHLFSILPQLAERICSMRYKKPLLYH